MVKMKTKTLFTSIGFIVITLLILSLFNAISVLGYDWNRTNTMILNEDDNIGYGLFNGTHGIESQLVQVDYETDIRYVKEGIGATTDSYDNDSYDWQRSSGYYDSFYTFSLEDREWVNLPTYIQAFNNTGFGPNVTITSGVVNLGSLNLDEKTILEVEKEMVYVYAVDLKAGELYDLNILTTENGLTYMVYYEGIDISSETLSSGFNRYISPLYAVESGTYLIYLYGNKDNNVIIEPRKLAVYGSSAGATLSDTFVNNDEQFWNETRMQWQDTKSKENVHSYFYEISEGDYRFKYVPFDNPEDTYAIFISSAKSHSASFTQSYSVFGLGDPGDEFIDFHVAEDTNILVLILSDLGTGVEFDYLLSLKSESFPILTPGEVYNYLGDLVTFGINIEETQLVYLNSTDTLSDPLTVARYEENNEVFIFSYGLENLGIDSEKIILEPGYYVFYLMEEDTYDFEIQLNVVPIESFNHQTGPDYAAFNLEQANGSTSNYKVFNISTNLWEFTNFNFTFLTEENYTVDLTYLLYFGRSQSVFTGATATLGNQQDINGTYQAYFANDSQRITFLGQKETNDRYILLYVNELYNNTGYVGMKGDVVVNQTLVSFQIKYDPDYPDDFNTINVHEIPLTSGVDEYFREFDHTTFSTDLYILKGKLPLYTWYNLNITIVNGTKDTALYVMNNFEPTRSMFLDDGVLLLNRYYQNYPGSSTYYYSYYQPNVSIPLRVFDTQFGVLSEDFLFMFSIRHIGLNGTVHFEFIPYNCTSLLPLEYGEFEGLKKLSTGAIVAISVTAGVLGVGATAFVVLRTVKKPKI